MKVCFKGQKPKMLVTTVLQDVLWLSHEEHSKTSLSCLTLSRFHLFIVISTVYCPPLHRWPRICINTIMLLPLNLRMRTNHCQPQHFPRPHTESAGKTWRVCKNKVHNHLKGFVSCEAPPLQTASSSSPLDAAAAVGVG